MLLKNSPITFVSLSILLSPSLQAGIQTYQETPKAPLPICGLVGSIDQRIAQCESLSTSGAPSTRRLKAKGGSTTVWNLVNRTKDGKEMLYNADLGLIWTDVSGMGVEDIDMKNHAQATAACSDSEQAQDIKGGLNLQFRLPTVEEAKRGIALNLKDAFLNNLYFGRRDGGNSHGSILPSWTSYSFFTDQLVTTKQNKVYAMIYDGGGVSQSSNRVDYYEIKTISGKVYRGYEARHAVRCVASVTPSDMSAGQASDEQVAQSILPHPNNSSFQMKSVYALVEGGKPLSTSSNHPRATVDQPCVEFRIKGLFKETQYKRWLVAQPLLDAGYKPMKITFGRYYIRDQFCTRDDSAHAAYLADGVSAPSMPLYVSADGNQIVGYDYKTMQIIPVWTKLGTADNGESIYLHHPTNLVLSEKQEGVMNFKEGSERAKEFSLSFTSNNGKRVTIAAGMAEIPTGNQWAQFGRDGIAQLRDSRIWNRDSIWAANTSGTFLSRRWMNGSQKIVAPDGDVYFSAFVGTPQGNASSPYGFVDNLMTLVDSKAKRKVIFAIPASAVLGQM